MLDNVVNLKNIYRFLRENDYPVYSNGILPKDNFRGLTLVSFWTRILVFRWRNTNHGKIIWRTEGSKNRYHSELCNRKHTFPYYKEYTKEILEDLTEQEFYDQMERFMDFLGGRKYSHENFRKKLEFYLDVAGKHDCIFQKEAFRYFQESLSFYNDRNTTALTVDAWFLTMLTLHAIAGEEMDDSLLNYMRQDKRFYPDRLLQFTDNKETRILEGSVSFLTNKNTLLAESSLSPYNFFGREQELYDLRDAHRLNRKLLISSHDGSGKTELLRQYIRSILKQRIKIQLAAIRYENSIANSFSRSFRDLPGSSLQIRFKNAVSLLSADPYFQTIVLIDNMDQPDEDHDAVKILAELPCTVIITSTLDVLPGFTTYHLPTLDINSASLIFRNNYGKALTIKDKTSLYHFLEQEKISSPLILTLLAKSAGYSRISIEELSQSFHANKTMPEESYTEWVIEKLHTGLGPTECSVLCLFADLPYKPYSMETFLSMMPAEQAQSAEPLLYQLEHRGWLECGADGYSMHPVIANYFKNKYGEAITAMHS